MFVFFCTPISLVPSIKIGAVQLQGTREKKSCVFRIYRTLFSSGTKSKITRPTYQVEYHINQRQRALKPGHEGSNSVGGGLYSTPFRKEALGRGWFFERAHIKRGPATCIKVYRRGRCIRELEIMRWKIHRERGNSSVLWLPGQRAALRDLRSQRSPGTGSPTFDGFTLFLLLIAHASWRKLSR